MEKKYFKGVIKAVLFQSRSMIGDHCRCIKDFWKVRLSVGL